MPIFNKGYESGAGQAGHADTMIAQGVRVEGDFKSDGNVVIEGEVKGSVATSLHLSVGDRALIVANVKAGSATVAGIIEGNVTVLGKLELLGTAQITGDVSAEDLSVESGAIMNGRITMTTSASKSASSEEEASEEN